VVETRNIDNALINVITPKKDATTVWMSSIHLNKL